MSSNENPKDVSITINQLKVILSLCEKEWYRTQNPVWIWRALSVTWSRDEDAEYGTEESVWTPHWCQPYLGIVANRLMHLAEGFDWRETGRDFYSDKSFEELRTIYPTVDPDRALQMVPAALGLSRKGWNAFGRDDAEAAQEEKLVLMLTLMGAGSTRAAARRAFMEQTGLQDERTVRELQKKAEAWRRARRVFPDDD